jgi:hypothetical protein
VNEKCHQICFTSNFPTDLTIALSHGRGRVSFSDLLKKVQKEFAVFYLIASKCITVEIVAGFYT